jgi:hypothetical protein
MTMRFFNGLQIDVPEGWTDLTTIVVAPRKELENGQKPGINLVVKRRPAPSQDTSQTLRDYLRFMQGTFGKLEELETREMVVGSHKGQAVRFVANAEGRKFRQVTLLYVSNGEEISATVTQLIDDPTPMKVIERLLRSIKPAAGGIHGLK